MSPLMTGIATGVLASLMLTPLGGLAIGVMAYYLAKKDNKDV